MSVCVSILFLFCVCNVVVVFLCACLLISHYYLCVIDKSPFFLWHADLSCTPPFLHPSLRPSSVECWRGWLLGGDGQRSHRLVPLRLCGGSDASEPRQPIRWSQPVTRAQINTHAPGSSRKLPCITSVGKMHLLIQSFTFTWILWISNWFSLCQDARCDSMWPCASKTRGCWEI